MYLEARNYKNYDWIIALVIAVSTIAMLYGAFRVVEKIQEDGRERQKVDQAQQSRVERMYCLGVELQFEGISLEDCLDKINHD